MKRQIVQLVVLLVFLVSAASCSSSRNTSSSRYPSGTGTRSQRTSDIPGIFFPDSRTTSSKGLPPGQAKKIYGGQSAKAYAPGQQKKSGHGHGNGKGNGNGNGNHKKKGKKH